MKTPEKSQLSTAATPCDTGCSPEAVQNPDLITWVVVPIACGVVVIAAVIFLVILKKRRRDKKLRDAAYLVGFENKNYNELRKIDSVGVEY